MVNFCGNVSNVENNISFLKIWMTLWRKVGALLDNNMSEIDSLKSENLKLRNYISLISAEIELSQRVSEIKQNFANSADSKRLITPILDRILKIKSEKEILATELKLI
jgi:hypothetical protein